MKAVLLALHPQWVKEIFVTKRKKIDVRKTAPNLETPFKVYVYQTKHKGGKAIVSEVLNSVYGGGKVIGSFVCDRIDEFDSEWSEWAYACAPTDIPCAMPMSEGTAIEICKEKACLTHEDIIDYFGDEEWRAYFWHITEPKLFEKPRELWEFYAPCRKGKETADESCKGCPYAFKGAVTGEIICDNVITRPPQSFCYIDVDE